MLREARAAGEVPAERDLGLARMFLFGALNWSVEWYDPGKGDLDAFVHEAAETFLHGILGHPGGCSGYAHGGRRIAGAGSAATGPCGDGGRGE